MKTKCLSVNLLAALLCWATSTAAAASNPFRDATSSIDGFTTWDSDLINIEQVTQTGQGVYIAVLDTGLVPNWADYFPKERIATKLGTGFDQSVIFRADKSGTEYETEMGRLRQTTWVGSRGSTHGTHVASTIVG